MEEEKAAAYYDELTRKGEGAAKFKQGLGFSSSSSSSNNNSVVPSRGSALASSSSFLSSFVRASSPSKTTEFEKQAQLQSIQNKLNKKNPKNDHNYENSRNPWVSKGKNSRSRSPSWKSKRRSRSRSRDSRVSKGKNSRSRSPSRERRSSRRSQSPSRSSKHRSRSRGRSRDSYRLKRRDRSRSRSRSRDRYRKRENERKSRRRSRSVSPRDRRSEKVGKDKSATVDYSKLIEGYEKMTPAERVEAKMKLQLSETARKDETKSMGPGWERFDFDKDAPLDDEEIEAAEDDAALVSHIGKSFRFSAVETRREEQIKAAHDEAIFGTPSLLPLSHSTETDDEAEEDNGKRDTSELVDATSLISEQALAMQQGSWRDRVRRS